MATKKKQYDDNSIKTLDSRRHIRHRPGMFIGKLGDGTSEDDGIYILLKEVMDNCLDEFMMGYGNTIHIDVSETTAKIRDHGRGIPHGKLVDSVSKINTSAKFDDSVFERSIGMNGVGVKAVNALSAEFVVRSKRDGKTKEVSFKEGEIAHEKNLRSTEHDNSWNSGTEVIFTPDRTIFGDFRFDPLFIKERLELIAFLNKGLKIVFNDEEIFSDGGLNELLCHYIKESEMFFKPIELESDELKFSFTYLNTSRERSFSFVNGQYTREGGTHVFAFRDCFTRIINQVLNKDFDSQDIKNGLAFALSFRMAEPIFESQTKTKLGSTTVKIKDNHPLFSSLPGNVKIQTSGDGVASANLPIKDVIEAYLLKTLVPKLLSDKNLCKNIEDRIHASAHERKEILGLKKLAKTKEKEASFYNKKLRDSKYHQSDKTKRGHETTLFITEGDSAAGSITQVRDVETQAVFSLRGKPLNTLGVSRKLIFANEELNLLQHAVGIDDEPEMVRYKKIVIATDADVDGMHIRLLLMTFFLQFYPKLVDSGQVSFLLTPLFRIRKGGKTLAYYFTDDDLARDLKKRTDTERKNLEITRFKGLGEISPDEMAGFISRDGIKLQRLSADVISTNLNKKKSGNNIPKTEVVSGVKDILSFYMGDNTPERQKYILDFLEASVAKLNK